MIESTELINFRSWKNALIEFCPGVNVITGENDSGKTNILRGINWVANNRPSGEDVRSNWGGDTISRLTLKNGNESPPTIERFRSDSENLYKIVGQKEPFRSFGQGVPESISKILNFNSVNIQFQLEGPFLLGKSSADVAKYYNEAVNLEIIDRSIANIARTLRTERGELAKLKGDQESQTKKLKEFDWLTEAEKGLIKLEKMQVIIRRLESEYTSLSGLASDLKIRNEEYNKLNEITKHEKSVRDLIELDRQIDIKTAECNELEASIGQLKSLKERSRKLGGLLQYENKVNGLILQAEQIDKEQIEIEELKEICSKLTILKQQEAKGIAVLKFESKVNGLIELDKRINAKTGEYNELFDLIKQRDKLNTQLETANKHREDLEAEFKKNLPEEMCPILDIPCEHLKERKET